MPVTTDADHLDDVHLLHVDDDASFAELTSTFLERLDDRFTVETATSADAGLDCLDARDVDCIVSDYDMPGTNGIEFLETVREDHPDLPFILYTGKGSETVASEAFSAGATDYLQKESGTEQYTLLANKVTNYVEKYHTEREVRRRARAMETANEGIAILDEEGRYRSLNEAYAEICGAPPDAVLGDHWASTLPDAEVDRLRAEAFPKLAAQSSWTGEATGERPDGSTYTKQLSLAPLDDGGHVCIARDVTEQKERERALRRYERMVDTLREAVCVYDRDGRFVVLNETVAEFYDTTCEALEGQPSPFVQRLRNEGDGDPYQELLDGERDELRGEFESEFPGHGHALLDYRLTPLTVDGSVQGVVCVSRAVSDHKRRERQLQRYERIVEVSGDPVYTLDADGYFTFVNDRLVEQIGHDRDAVIGTHVSTFVDDDDVEDGRELIRSLLAGEDDRDTFELDLVTASGERRTCEAHVALVVSDGEFHGTVGVLRDITDRKRQAAELRRKNDRLERFASLVSHDLRNPLNVAQGRLELAREDVDDCADLDATAAALDRCQGLVDDLLSLAREGDHVDDPVRVSLGTTVRNGWQHVETGDATLTVDTDATVLANRSRLQQLLENLIRNAVEHGSTSPRSDAPESAAENGSTGSRLSPDDALEHDTPDATASTVTVTVGDLSDGFYVADDGPGIPEDERGDVFDSGYSTSEGGTGFGLSIVREIAEAHDWSVSVTESDDGGARFEVTGVDRFDAA